MIVFMQSRKELAKARQFVDRMRYAQDADAFEAEWKAYLNALERVWSKAEAQMKPWPKFQGWTYRGKVMGLRSSDELLAYLRNARGADEHSIADLMGRTGGGIGINPAHGNSLYIKRMEINNGVITIDSPQTIRVTYFREHAKLIPIVNRGKTYPPPQSHLGNLVNPADIISIAQAGIRFYEGFLDVAEKFI